MSTVGDTQFHGGYHDARKGHYEYREVFSTGGGGGGVLSSFVI